MQKPGSTTSVPVAAPETTTLRKFSPDESCRFKRLSGPGRRVVIRLTYRCDLACPHCLVGNNLYQRVQELSFSEWETLLVELPAVQARKVLLTGGEPLLFPDLAQVVGLISQQGIPVDLNSNLQRITPALMKALAQAGLTEISVSIEGPEAIHDRMHGRAGAFRQMLQALQWARELGIMVDASCCLARENYNHLDELLGMIQILPLQSFTVSRLFPIGHGLSKAQAGLAQDELDAIHRRLGASWVPHSAIPIRLVGLLHVPERKDCGRGTSLIGITPQGEVLPCVLTEDNPARLPHPLKAGLAAAVAEMNRKLAEGEYRLCCQAPQAAEAGL